MSVRALAPTALMLALAVPLAAASGQGFRYAPGTTQYRMTVEAKVTQTMMGQNNTSDVSSGQKFTMALSPQSSDTMAMVVTIDSIAQVTPMGPMPGLDSLIGRKVQAFVSPTGEFFRSVAPASDSTGMLSSLSDQLVHVLPRIRAALTDGATWTDTVNASSVQNGLELKRTVISVYKVDGDTVVGGVKGRRLRRTSNSTSSGTGNMQGQSVTLDGTSTGTGVAVVTTDGAFLGSAGSEDAKATLTLPDQGVTVNMETTAQTKVERVAH